MPKQPISARALTTAYIVALLIIAGMSIASHFALEASLQTNEGSAAIINKSGRQRMLSQRIAALASQWRSGDSEARGDLQTAVDQFETAHDFLVSAIRTDGSSDSDARKLKTLYFGPGGALDAEARGFIADARRVAAAEPGDAHADQPLSRVLAEARNRLLSALDNVVSLEQHRSERRISYLERLQWVILVTVLITLMVEASFIFRPMIRRIIDYMAELSRLATSDPLTGLFNRRGFLEQCETEVARAKRYGRPVSILILDVDHFKKVNDTYGHDAGDAVLAAVGGALRTALRQIDIFGRLGGEEFGVLLVETALPKAMLVAERLRLSLASMEVPVLGTTIKITASIGCTCLGEDASGLEDGLRMADQLMYQAKRDGRNCVVADVFDAAVA